MKRYLSMFLVLTVFLTSCDKDVEEPSKANPNPIVGLWTGTYQLSSRADLGSFYYSLDIKADSSVLVHGSGISPSSSYAKGTWRISVDSVFTANLSTLDGNMSGNKQTVTAKYSPSKGMLSGVTTDTEGNNSNISTFSLTRVN